MGRTTTRACARTNCATWSRDGLLNAGFVGVTPTNLRPATFGGTGLAVRRRPARRGRIAVPGPGRRCSNTRRAWHWRSSSRRASTTTRAMARRCRGCSTPCAGKAARRVTRARILFHSATRSAFAASTASASPSIFTRSILSPCFTASTTSRPSTTLPNTVCLPSSHGVGDVGDEELAAVGVRAGIGHGQHAARRGAGRCWSRPRSGSPGRRGRSPRGQPPWTMKSGMTRWKLEAVVEAALGQVDEVGDGQRRLVGGQLDADRAAGGVENGDQGHAGAPVRVKPREDDSQVERFGRRLAGL